MTGQARLIAVLEKCLFTWLADDETVAGGFLRAKLVNRLPVIFYSPNIVVVLMLHIIVVGAVYGTRIGRNGDFGQVVPCIRTHFFRVGSIIAVIPAAQYAVFTLVKVIPLI